MLKRYNIDCSKIGVLEITTDVNGSWVTALDAQLLVQEIQVLSYKLTELTSKPRKVCANCMYLNLLYPNANTYLCNLENSRVTGQQIEAHTCMSFRERV